MKKITAILCVLALVLTCSACTVRFTDAQLDSGNQLEELVESDNYAEVPYSPEVNDDYDEYEETERYCEQLVAQGDYLAAYQYIDMMASEDTIYLDLLSKYTQLYVDDALATAKRYADSGSYEQAIYVLEEANKVYNCSDFSLAIEEYDACLPKKLSNIHRIDYEDYHSMSTASDCFGNEYSEVFGFGDSLFGEDGGYAVFYLNGKYTNLSGVFVGSNELYKNMEVSCKIYADGKLIYESSRLGRTSPAVNIDLDVTGTEQLRVEYMYYTWCTDEPSCIFDLTVS